MLCEQSKQRQRQRDRDRDRDRQTRERGGLLSSLGCVEEEEDRGMQTRRHAGTHADKQTDNQHTDTQTRRHTDTYTIPHPHPRPCPHPTPHTPTPPHPTPHTPHPTPHTSHPHPHPNLVRALTYGGNIRVRFDLFAFVCDRQELQGSGPHLRLRDADRQI